MIASIQHMNDSDGSSRTRGEGQSKLTMLTRCNALLEGSSSRIAGTRVLISLINDRHTESVVSMV